MKNLRPSKRARLLRCMIASCLLIGLVAVLPRESGAQDKSVKPNYDLASKWTTQKVGKLVFDTSVTPRWLETGDRFWYSFQTNQGRRFYLVDAAAKTRKPLFDPVKMASMLTTITRNPYDSQHLPITTVRFVKNDTAFQFDVSVPKDADVGTSGKTDQKQVTTDKERNDDIEFDNENELDSEAQERGGGRGQTGSARNKTLYFEYELASGKLALLEDFKPPARKPAWASLSPDEKTVIFARSHNLFMMDADSYAKALKKADDPTIVETQLTTDGEEHYSFARVVTPDEIQQEEQRQQEDRQQDERQQEAETASKDKRPPRVAPVNIVWSKDSRKISMVRRDQRKVGDLWVINALADPRPKLESYRYAMPGEENVAQYEILLFDLPTKGRVKVNTDRFKDQQVTIATARAPRVRPEPDRPAPPAQWLSDTPDKLYFTRLSRDMRKFDVCLANTATGEVQVLVEERLNTYIENKPLVLVNNGQEFVFWSERDGWGQYYLYDGKGALKNQITAGEFVCTGVEGIDEKTRTMYFTAAGKEPGEDPYFTHLYRINLDGTGLQLLNPGDASHAANVADSNKYFVDNFSRVNSAPKSVLYDTRGAVVQELEAPDLSALMESGYKYPEPFTVKADDGVTDLFGVMYKPFDFDPTKRYPIIAFVYPGPQTESVTKSFSVARNQQLALAQFGFIVIEVGNRGGNPQRSKWYHTYGYGNLRDYGLADKKAAIEQLAKRHPYIDINRVGIYGHSGGGFMSTAAMLVYPDFFKVAVSSSGNHENNVYNKEWSEKHHGVKEVADKDGKVRFEYSIEKNSEIARNLKGHLLLVTGDIDNNVHPANTFRLADALIKANKRFDMFVIPGKRHAYADATDYFFWLRADYFCRHLLGESASTVDVTELNREKEQTGEKSSERSGAGSTGRRGPGIP